MKTLTILALAAILFVLWVIVSSGFTKRLPPPQKVVESRADRSIAAYIYAMNEGGSSFAITPSGSMEPYLSDGDFIVVVPVDFDSVKPGKIYAYYSDELPKGSPPITHFAAERLGDGFIMDGSANKHYDNGLMTKDNIVGEVVFIFKAK